MSHSDNLTSIIITPEFLAGLKTDQLVDLLQHRTTLLIASRKAGVKYPNFIKGLKKEVEMIQAELMKRKEGKQ